MVLILLIIRFCTVSSEFGLLCFKVFPRNFILVREDFISSHKLQFITKGDEIMEDSLY